MAHLENQTESGIILDRRQILTGAAALGMAGAFASFPAMAQSTPKKGGTLRMGMEGGSPSDSLDPLTYADSIPINMSLMLWNNLIEVADDGDATGELFESWTVKPGAADWTFNVRKGVTFTSGKTLDADDVIYSLNMHRGETKSPAKALLADIKEIKKLSSHQVQITMSKGNVDLPYNLSDYHIIVVPNGFKDYSKPDGTGAFTLDEFQPGVRATFKRKPGNYWKPNRAYFDRVEVIYIGDANQRTTASTKHATPTAHGHAWSLPWYARPAWLPDAADARLPIPWHAITTHAGYAYAWISAVSAAHDATATVHAAWVLV